ncbi:MAG TPA: glycogen/starch/alpha-glucan phosphorylase [Gammaproteobacteria bacterium]|nr:glycogen/starch/alpha-glucan phosphorylase [Gammaproteobacteria bacterium]
MTKKRTRRAFQYDYQGLDPASIKHSLANRMVYTVGKDIYTATRRDWLQAVAYTVRDRLLERWMETQRRYYQEDSKRVYYLSLEFLIGRTLGNSLLNLGFYEECDRALYELGMDLEELQDLEDEAALGNGGLGRLAACILDGMATLRLPGYGYGIRYEFGMFRQGIEDGRQVEHPDNWLRYGNPWEFPRPEVLYPVHFYGHVVEYKDEAGRLCHQWVETDQVMAMAYDTPIPGYGVDTVNNMRLWAAKSTRDFELRYFNEGDYIKAVEDKTRSENLSKVLYPVERTVMGKELRLRQQYFFVSASIQDILYRFLKHGESLDALPDKVAIQLNDTHPVIAVPELMRILVDGHHLDWERAWDITVRTCAYTNHTLLPEALETWSAELVERMLPRHMQILYEINRRFLRDVARARPGETALLRALSLFDEDHDRQLRMAHLAVIGCHKVNGVSAVHSRLLRERVFPEMNRLYPDRFINVTNGITPRRWLHQANPGLSALIRSRLGDGWLTRLERLQELEAHVDDPKFRAGFRRAQQERKERLARLIRQKMGLAVPADSLFDVQAKRLHEYKRQLLNVLHVVTLYKRMRDDPDGDWLARTVIFAGKAAPDYYVAKQVIKLIHDVGDIVNNDPLLRDRLKVVFIPNYDVSTATDLIPAADLSQQISTAGTEASGTGNMKLALNGALTLGTRDGANIEISEAVGEENVFLFGHTVEEVQALREGGYDPWRYYRADPRLQEALEMIGSGFFSPEEPARHRALVERLTAGGDYYLLLADFGPYMAAQAEVERVYRDPEEWSRRAALNVARMGGFSIDRTVSEYAEKVWGVRPVGPEALG